VKKLDRFILRSFLGPFFAILLIVLFVLMLHTLWLYIDELVGKGLGLGVILEFLFWGVCIILPLALPLATLLSSMMTIGLLADHQELIAIKAAGVSLARIMLPLGIAAFIITICAFFAANDLVPKAHNEIFTLREDILETKEEIKITPGTFYDGIEGYILRANSQDDDGMMYDVMVYDHTGNKGNTALIISDSATIRISKGKDYLIFTLFNGVNYQETNVKKYRDTSLELQKVQFSKQELVIPLKNYSFEHSDSTRYGDQVKAMGVAQLSHQRDSLIKVSDSLATRHYSRIRSSVNLIYAKQLDTSVVRTQTQNFSSSDWMRWKSIDDKIEAFTKAKDNVFRMSSDTYSMNNESYESAFYLNHTNVEFMKKFAQALACFIFFFIGAPLGAQVRKGGLGTSAIISALFFVLYWVVDISGLKLGGNGDLNAFVGAFLSTFVLAPIGGFLTYKAINDSAIFGGDSFKNKIRMIWSKILRFFRPTKIVFMGTPEFAVASLEALLKKKYKVVGVVTVPDKPSGRGLQVNESAVKKYAVEHGIPVLQPVKLKDKEFLDALKEWRADLFVVVAFRMLPEDVWKMPKLGTFNLHAALLPQYRGAAPINWAVINGEKMTGVTTFMIDKDIDTGGIILRQECRIGPEDTAGDVHDALMGIGAELVTETVEGILQHNVETRLQRSFVQGSEVLKPAPKLTKALCDIDWTLPTTTIYNLVRGLSPYPAAFTTLFPLHQISSGTADLTEMLQISGSGQQLKIFRAEKLDMKGTPGQILTDGKTYLAVATGNGALGLKEVQLAGKKKMDVKAFLAGFREPEKYICIRSEQEKVL